ncbi:MAG: hypothetical protein ABIJ48_09835 [Actinomycetota bacterium]
MTVGKPLRRVAGSADRSSVLLLVCRNCGGVVVFGAEGWSHRDQGRPCPALVVAWPPPSDRDDD